MGVGVGVSIGVGVAAGVDGRAVAVGAALADAERDGVGGRADDPAEADGRLVALLGRGVGWRLAPGASDGSSDRPASDSDGKAVSLAAGAVIGTLDSTELSEPKVGEGRAKPSATGPDVTAAMTKTSTARAAT